MIKSKILMSLKLINIIFLKLNLLKQNFLKKTNIYIKIKSYIKIPQEIFRLIEQITLIKLYKVIYKLGTLRNKFLHRLDVPRSGAIAQLVEHLHGMQGVSGSSPLGSIRIFANYTY